MINAEDIENYRNYFIAAVKPRIEEGRLVRAAISLRNLMFQMLEYFQEIYPYHSAPNCYAEGRMILEELEEKRTPDAEQIQKLEAYLTQLGLAVRTGNKGNT